VNKTILFTMPNKTGIAIKLVGLAFCLFVVLASFQNIQTAKASSNVTFSVSYGWISGSFDSSIDIPSATILPSENKSLSCLLTSNKMTLALDIPNIGSTSLQVDPLGQHDYPIPVLSYNVVLGSVGLVLTLEGSIQGKLSADGNGTLNTNNLEWLNSGSQNAILRAPLDAKEGDKIQVTLDNIEYVISAGVKAEGDVLGQHIEQVIIANVPLGSVSGTPPSVTGSFTIVNSPETDTILWAAVATTWGATGITCFLFLRTRHQLKKVNKT
jgi:hypothetical protein